MLTETITLYLIVDYTDCSYYVSVCKKVIYFLFYNLCFSIIDLTNFKEWAFNIILQN